VKTAIKIFRHRQINIKLMVSLEKELLVLFTWVIFVELERRSQLKKFIRTKNTKIVNFKS